MRAAPALLLACLVVTGVTAAAGARALPGPPPGSMALRVSKANPRYFADASGRPVYLTGSHTWMNLVDRGTRRPPPRFDYAGYLRTLARHGHNFFRLWTWELHHYARPQPWRRTGPGRAADGLPKFDLRRFDPAYFGRLRARVVAARAHGMYVSVMLFEGWAEQFADRPTNWAAHPFNRRNNVNGVAAAAAHTLANPRITAIQRAYVRKVVRTVGDLDNVLFEIANETRAGEATPWQYAMIDEVRRYDAARGWRHPVGMTYQHGDDANVALSASSADWISPADRRWLYDPRPADGSKVILSDTDHHCGICGGADFVWRSFTRGHNPIFMEPMTSASWLEDARRAMGRTRELAQRIDLARAVPRPDACSTRLCLVGDSEYVVYQPDGGRVEVDVGAGGRFAVEWLRPLSGDPAGRGTVEGSGRLGFDPPFAGAAVLYLRAV